MNENQGKPQSDITKRYDELPDDVKQAMMSVASAEIIFEIGKKHGLNIEHIGKLAEEVGYVMLGMIPSKEFVSDLVWILGVREMKAVEIAKDVNTKIFLQIREALKKIHGSRFSEEITIAKPKLQGEPPLRPQPPSPKPPLTPQTPSVIPVTPPPSVQPSVLRQSTQPPPPPKVINIPEMNKPASPANPFFTGMTPTPEITPTPPVPPLQPPRPIQSGEPKVDRVAPTPPPIRPRPAVPFTPGTGLENFLQAPSAAIPPKPPVPPPPIPPLDKPLTEIKIPETPKPAPQALPAEIPPELSSKERPKVPEEEKPNLLDSLPKEKPMEARIIEKTPIVPKSSSDPYKETIE